MILIVGVGSMNKKKIAINVTILLVVMAFALIYLFKDNGVEKIKSLENLNWYYIVLLLLSMIVIYFIEGAIIRIASIGVKDDFSYKNSIIAYSIGNLGSNISPFKSLHYRNFLFIQ